jgi:superfamily II DNA or RNA helicase
MSRKFGSAFCYKVIYVFEINAETHKGLLKVGDASLYTNSPVDSLSPNSKELNQAALKRIRQYTNTAGLTPHLLHTELAVRAVKNDQGRYVLKPFRDYDVHRVLENSGIPKKKIKNSTSREWFETDFQTIQKAIDAVKKGQPNFTNTGTENFVPIIFRPEQEDAISKTIKQFKTNNRMLWNAKMRFGKTLSALEVVKKSGYSKTIIITHRPVVDKGWYEDFGKIFHGVDDYLYGSKNTGTDIDYLLSSGKKFVYFASIQDLRGSATVGGKFDKNDTVFAQNWDLVIVDEAHEGTTTALGDEVITKIVKESSGYNTKFLALSGTPFNILKDYDDNIYTWDYVMEQRSKKGWDAEHFGDSNPYDELPELWIYTYDLGQIISEARYVELEDKAFNFHEFFRTWTGNLHHDGTGIPAGKSVGDFYHEEDVRSFLNLITTENETNCYPYSNEEYRKLFRHTLWMVPGVQEAKALSKLLKKHPVFGSGAFEIVNVAGDGDEEEKSEDALKKVQDAIAAAGCDGYTITLSCGKLTTGVTVPEWTAVFMLAGSFSTSASSYLQTIFRVQSPCKKDGQVKQNCFVFDFAPDRTLKMLAEAAALSTKAGKATESDKVIMGEFLNYCPVISVSGTEMKQYDTNKLLQQLKRAYAERAVQNGFDDINLYNDELLKLDKLDLEKFKDLKGIMGVSRAAPKTNEIDINHQGFTDEQYEEIERIKKKSRENRSPEEEARLKELQEKRKQKSDAISILRGISIRIPLLIYGADINITEDITINQLTAIVDDKSWDEFMPAGVTKAIFKSFIKYYDPEVFIAAGRKIRAEAYSADSLPPLDRVKKITTLFSCFKNPDKETVLTPWRVVNMHMSDCIGGYDFYNETHTELRDKPRFVDRGKVTADTFSNTKAQILEINSKTGLYPLYVTYSIYRTKCSAYSVEQLDEEMQQKLWDETVRENVFVICKTPMAKFITRRTLVGYRDAKVNAHYFDDLINMLKNKPENFTKKVLKCSYWNKDCGGNMKFDAVVGNPPYQVMDGGNRASASPVYQLFVTQAKNLNPSYLSMITPSRWFAGGKGLDEFRAKMLSDTKISRIIDYADSTACFQGVDIAGGVSYFLWDKNYCGQCLVTSIRGASVITTKRRLDEYDIFVRNNASIELINRIIERGETKMDEKVRPRNVFGITTDEHGQKMPDKVHTITLICSQKGNQLAIAYIDPEKIMKNQELINKYKVVIGRSVPRNGEVGVDPRVGYRAITTVHILCPKMVFTDTYLLLSAFDTLSEAENFAKYMTLKLPRFLLHETYTSMAISKDNFRFVPYLDYKHTWTDAQLYERYHCTEDEINMIEGMIRPLEYVVHK